MKRALILLLLLAATLVIAFRAIGHAPLGENGIVAVWLPMPEGLTVVGANYDHPDLDFNAGRGNARFRSSRPVAELKQYFEDWLYREGFVAIDGMHRVVVTEPAIRAFAVYACHRTRGQFLNIVGSEQRTPTGGSSGVTFAYWESPDLALVQSLFGLKPGERPCDD